MKRYVKAAEEESRGVFWIVEDELLAFPFEDTEYGVAKSGNTYNHKKLWEYVKPRGCNKPFDYYPRGRVEFSGKGTPIIYMNPNISDEYVEQITKAFELKEDPIVKYDGSEHYKCYLDR